MRDTKAAMNAVLHALKACSQNVSVDTGSSTADEVVTIYNCTGFNPGTFVRFVLRMNSRFVITNPPLGFTLEDTPGGVSISAEQIQVKVWRVAVTIKKDQ